MVSCDPLDERKHSICQHPEPWRTVTSTLQARTAWAVTFITVGLLTLSRVLQPPQEWQWTVDFITRALSNVLIILACAGVGLLIVSRRPDNVIGWIYALAALVFAAGEFAAGYTSRPLPGRMWTALLPDLAWTLAIPLGATLLLLLYPTGRPPSPRWRPVVWAVVVATVLAVVASVVKPGPTDYLPRVDNPLGLEQAEQVRDLIELVAWAVIAAAVFSAAGSLILRWRRARGIERQQLKWLAYAAAMLVVVTVAQNWLPRALSVVIIVAMTLLFPVATAIAVVRYRLYDIDRIINRTLVYGFLTALLAGVYAGVVLVLGEVFGDQRPAELGGGRRDPGRGGAVPAGTAPHSRSGGSALQPTQVRCRQDRRGLQPSTSGRGRPGRLVGRATGRGRSDDPADEGVAVASANG
jgi:hypothetical protein